MLEIDKRKAEERRDMMYKITLKARGQEFDYSCAENVTPLEQHVIYLFLFQQAVSEADAVCVR